MGNAAKAAKKRRLQAAVEKRIARYHAARERNGAKAASGAAQSSTSHSDGEAPVRGGLSVSSVLASLQLLGSAAAQSLLQNTIAQLLDLTRESGDQAAAEMGVGKEILPFKELECTACNQLMVDPAVLPCGHSFWYPPPLFPFPSTSFI